MRTLNLCLDLNVWCAAFLADRKGMNGTSSQVLVRYARSGRIGDVPVQLVISWAMLTRLRKVLEVDWGLSRETVDPVIEAIAGYAHMGAAGLAPHVILGGTGLMPIRDTEDGHVLDTAIAGKAHLLVTANFDDFIFAKSSILEPSKVGIVTTANAKLVIAHPYRAVSWLQQNIFPDVEAVTRLKS
jgi:predicted nucleic acid-binding protein